VKHSVRGTGLTASEARASLVLSEFSKRRESCTAVLLRHTRLCSPPAASEAGASLVLSEFSKRRESCTAVLLRHTRLQLQAVLSSRRFSSTNSLRFLSLP
jgi:hypothetical protein